MDLSRTVSELNGDVGRKSQSFPTLVHLMPPCTETTPIKKLKICIGFGLQKVSVSRE